MAQLSLRGHFRFALVPFETDMSTVFKRTRGIAYSPRNTDFQLFLLRERFVSQFQEYNALLSSHPMQSPPNEFIAFFSGFHEAEETMDIHPIEFWKTNRTPDRFTTLGKRAETLVESFQARHSTSTRLVNGQFLWEGLFISILAEITLPQSSPHSTAKIVRHAIMIEKADT
jgi:hypothetical protein